MGTLARHGLLHCVESVRIWSFSGLYFPAVWLNAQRYFVSLRTQSEYGKMRTRKTPNTDTFYVILTTTVCIFNVKSRKEKKIFCHFLGLILTHHLLVLPSDHFQALILRLVLSFRLQTRLVRNERLHWNSWWGNCYNIYESYGNTEPPYWK